jgi:hypothetical protein
MGDPLVPQVRYRVPNPPALSIRRPGGRVARRGGDAVDAPARPALDQARVDQSERHVVVAVCREVSSQPFGPFRGVTGDREPLADLRCGKP